MTFTVHLKKAIELSPTEIADCKRLSYGDEGYMSEDLDRILRDERRWRYRYSYVVLVTDPDNNKVIGWSLIEPRPRSPRWIFQCFVDPDYRRQGIGRYLLQQAVYFRNRKVVAYLDEDNEGFFEKFPELYTEV